MTKREKLEKLDESVLDAMIDLMDKKKYAEVKDLGTVVTYLKNNQVLTPPKKEGGVGSAVREILDK